jgi:D-alanyl-D-alanine carboxypeptidase/D-alanyl-D-alanine-endopeptidase (penicillin-binding protein 4)
MNASLDYRRAAPGLDNPTMSVTKTLLGLVLSCLYGLSPAQALPPDVLTALARAKVPLEAVSLLVVDADGKAPPRLSHRASVPVNPASVMKLVTTYAALDLLGPAFSWRTPVLVEGAVRDGTLYGNLYIVGQGDPKLVLERLWLLLRRVQALGIHTIAGDLVLDRSAFEAIEADPAGFDGEPLKPYNAAPDALLINFKSVVMTFVPERSSNTARVQFEPPLAGVQMQTSLPLAGGDCGDYRGAVKADFSDATRIRFAGSYPTSCGEKVWPVAYADPQSYSVRAIQGLWREMGGKLSGTVREGRLPQLAGAASKSTLEPAFEISSAPLAEIIRDINKYSNNVMAQQLFLTLGLQAQGANGSQVNTVATRAASRAVVGNWWKDRIQTDDAPVLDNGSGLSRHERISARALGHLLQSAYRSPLMPDLMASLPITGVDGTLKNRRAGPVGSAHLKTGSLRDVTAVAGYVHSASGKRTVLVAIANHPNASAARPAIAALVEWAAKEN